MTGGSLCASEQQPGITANFGHRRSLSAAKSLQQKAEARGFQNVAVQRRGCNDYATVLTGLRNLAQGKEFRREARAAGFRVVLECRSHPPQAGIAAVFGHRRTRAAAERLRARAEGKGFRGLRVQQDACADWEVDLHGLATAAQRREFAREARTAGFRVTFEPG